MRSRRKPEIITGRVNGDGSIASGDGFTVLKNGTGFYVVTLTAPGFRLIAAVANYFGGGFAFTQVVSISAGNGGFVVNTGNASAVAADLAFSFIAVGVQQ